MVGTLIGLSQLWVCTKPVFATVLGVCISYSHSSGCVQHSVCYCLGMYNTVFVTVWVCTTQCLSLSGSVQHSVCYCYVIQHQHLSQLKVCTTQCLLLLCYTTSTFITALGVYNTSVCHCLGVYNTSVCYYYIIHH